MSRPCAQCDQFYSDTMEYNQDPTQFGDTLEIVETASEDSGVGWLCRRPRCQRKWWVFEDHGGHLPFAVWPGRPSKT